MRIIEAILLVVVAALAPFAILVWIIEKIILFAVGVVAMVAIDMDRFFDKGDRN